ncbi:glycoprotease family-domain-containing protein [Xylariaceae sp. FL1651]|nr:glycoprotease family-domain-containing protein [Xylariaceae sp. FL1651]
MSPPWIYSRQCVLGGRMSRQLILSTSRLLSPSACSTHLRRRSPTQQARRQLLTLAIETSCDDTCVAILEKSASGAARLHFHEKVTSDNRAFRGVHPLTAVISHTTHLAPLIQKALRALPEVSELDDNISPVHAAQNGRVLVVDGHARSKPDFISVTRGPGMTSNLATGLNTAKGLAVAWDVPLLGVNHMQAHALTPRLVSALRKGEGRSNDEGQPTKDPIAMNRAEDQEPNPQFPFLSLLVSGGHTILVHSRSLNDHGIIAQSPNIAVGDMLDKCARLILPPEILSPDNAKLSESAMYGPLLEEFAFPSTIAGIEPGAFSNAENKISYNYTAPARRADELVPFDSEFGWTLTPPLANMGKGALAASTYDFAGLNGQVQKIVVSRPEMNISERRLLARETMRLVFEHLTSRLLFSLRNGNTPRGGDDVNKSRDEANKGGVRTEDGRQNQIKTVVLSGGVASNKFLRHVVRAMLDVRGYTDVDVVAPPVSLCTDNAAMIAWTGLEMYEQGWRSELDVLTLRKWPLDPNAEDGGILGAPGWSRVYA